MKRQNKQKIETPKKDFRIRRFVLIYIILMVSFFFFIAFKPIQDILDINGLYTEAIVFITAKFLALLNIPASASGSLIKLPEISLDVKFGCNGLEAVMIYSCAVLAYPASIKLKALGVLGGFLVIQILNLIRIVALGYAAVNFRSLFDLIHIYVAQGIMIVIALGAFFIFLHYVERVREKAV